MARKLLRPARHKMQANWFLLEDNSSPNGLAQIFSNPVRIIRANNINEIESALKDIQIAQKDGFYLAGFISYEFGLCFENKTKDFVNSNFPLLYFGVFNSPRKTKAKAISRYLSLKNKNNGFWLGKPNYSNNYDEYKKKFDIIHSNIIKGDIYQANLTFDAKFEFKGAPIALYEKLRNNQKVKYGAYIEFDDYQILSLSPELFFSKTENKIETHPMKGTLIFDGKNTQDDLKNDIKQRAENLMITDLMRNDLSKIARKVEVSELFAIEKYSTLFQMISKISGSLKSEINITQILENLSPAGSITGCPKIRAEELIFETEARARDIYCGAIGMISPNGDALFNVAIRTPIIHNNELKIGIGSGIVYDSHAKDEYQECILKTKFLTQAQAPLSIFETLKWTKDKGFWRLENHLQRMEKSAINFNIKYDREIILSALNNVAQNIYWNEARIKIKINDEGHEIEIAEFIPNDKIYKITLSKTIMNSKNIWLYHKTTNREIYDKEWQKYSDLGFDEIIYLNENGELTEGSRTNIFLDFGDGILYTPEIKSGVLSGILRAELIENGKAIEKMLQLDDIYAAQHIYVGNALRGLKKAVFTL